MNISLNWLQDYVDIHEKADEIAETLTMAGLAVDSVVEKKNIYKGFIVGEVKQVKAHPHADRLTLCDVSDGRNVHSVVCGARNVAAGQKVVLAKPGAVVPLNGLKVKSVEIRGELSSGMICSEKELMLGDDHEGILVLPPSARAGTTFSKFYWNNDVVFEIDVTPNRSDCLSHIGVARELAALFGRRLKIPALGLREAKSNLPPVTIRILDPEHCPRYTGRVLSGVSETQSPEWLRRRLEAVGVRSINAIVDVTNYVMLECGQPLHAFDYDLIGGRKIIVRLASRGERLTTLDGKERTLHSNNLLICDAERAVAIGGVMGGLNSEIGPDTKSVLLESAHFSPSSVRKTARQLGISTEASYRFERSVDPGGTVYAIDRAAMLIHEITGAVIQKGRVDVYPGKRKPVKVLYRPDQFERVIGIRLPVPEVRKIFSRLGISVEKVAKNGAWKCSIPLYRPDIEREIDLIEEAARIHGFDRVPAHESAEIDFGATLREKESIPVLREWFQGAGFNEIICNSMVPEAWIGLCALKGVIVRNPQSKDMTFLRNSLLPGMLQAVAHNKNRGNNNLRFYEIGRIFAGESLQGGENYIDNYYEAKRIGLISCGVLNPADWSLGDRRVDFFDLKGEVEALMVKFNLDKVEYNIYHSTSNTLIDEGISVDYQGVPIGYVGSIRKRVLQTFDIDSEIFAAELDVSVLKKNLTSEKKFKELPKFPPAYRDLAFVLDERITYSELEKHIRLVGGSLLGSIRFFDLYRGEKLGAGKKSIAIAIELLSPDRTLTSAEVDETVGRIVDSAGEKFGASLRI